MVATITTTVVTRTDKTTTAVVGTSNVKAAMVVVISNAKAVASNANRTKSRLPTCRW